MRSCPPKKKVLNPLGHVAWQWQGKGSKGIQSDAQTETRN